MAVSFIVPSNEIDKRNFAFPHEPRGNIFSTQAALRLDLTECGEQTEAREARKHKKKFRELSAPRKRENTPTTDEAKTLKHMLMEKKKTFPPSL